MTEARPAIAWLALLFACACASACAASATEAALDRGDVRAAIAAYEAERAYELDALQRIAERVLIEEARAFEEARSTRALWLLRGLGPSGARAFEELEREPGDHRAALVRTHALAFRAGLGDAPARRALRALEEDARATPSAVDSERIAIALEALHPERDEEALLGWARSASAAVRAVAIGRLAQAPQSAATRALLVERARTEPDPSTRLQAIRALASQGEAASGTLEMIATEAAGTASARAAALSALLEVAPERAKPLCAAVLSDAPSALGVELAQAILSHASGGVSSLEATAEHQILAALAAPKPDLRSRAASAALAVARGAGRAKLRTELAIRLEAERDRRVHVLLALALRPDAQAKAALRTLMAARDVPAAQAAAELAAEREPGALARLSELARSDDPAVRAAASAGLARAHDFARIGRGPAGSVRALLDSDARVRAPAAAALVREIERLRTPRA